MVASRLSDAQKQKLVQRWRAGESSAALADSFGCSPNTVTRVVKLALAPELYEQLKKDRGRPVAQLEVPLATASIPVTTQEPAAGRIAADVPGPSSEPEPKSKSESKSRSDPAGDLDLDAANELDGVNELDPDSDDDGTRPGVLAIDDADDFGDDSDGDDSEGDGGGDDGDDTDAEGNVFTMVPVVAGAHFSAAAAGLQERSPVVCQPLESAPLPSSLYMLVDKTVELQARPLSDFPELGALPDDEQARQALVVFANPRQAKRQCGRTQRVIKMPDSQVIQRTATYLVGQGITRLVLEGALYALPGG